MSFYQTATLLPRQFRLVLASFLQKAGLPFADLLSEEQIQQAFDDEDASFAEGEDDISWRGLVNKRCCLGRRFTARGSTRPGRLPTVWAARCANSTSTSLAATSWSSNCRNSPASPVSLPEYGPIAMPLTIAVASHNRTSRSSGPGARPFRGPTRYR